MASLRRHSRTKFWIACYTGADGGRYQRSTRIAADNSINSRRQAQKIADSFEDASRKTSTARQVQRVLADHYREIAGTDLPHSTAEHFLREWLNRRAKELSAASLTFYRIHIDHFLEFLGENQKQPLTRIDQSVIRKFRDALSERLAPATVNHSLKILRMVFADAKRDGLIADSPTEGIPILKKGSERARRAFKINELRILLQHADDEWRSLILFGLYTGQRLGDLARLRWQSIHTEQSEIRFVTSKTKRQIILPIAGPLLKHIATLPAADAPDAYVHPRAARIVADQEKVGMLSRQFYDLMADAGLVQKKAHRKREKSDGPDQRRALSDISFHALRHTATSLMKNAGISPAIVEEFIGHDSREINRLYTHIEIASLQRAADTLPDILTEIEE